MNLEIVPVFEGPFLAARIDRRGLHWLVPGRDYRLPDGPLTLLKCFEQYVAEHCVPSGGDPDRAWIAFRAWGEALGWDRDCATLTRQDGRTIVEREMKRVTAATARKHLTLGIAALNHARKEERLTKDIPKFQMPAASQPRLRWLTRDEHKRLMALPLRERRMFWLLAFGTGARTAAMLELTWDRVDFAQRTIDYRVPGAVYKNKRRAVVPIHDKLLPRLQSAYELRDPACPFVVNKDGRQYSGGSLYHECKRDLAAIGIKERGVARHVARHTVASWILQDGGRLEDVAKLLGDTVAMVERVYGHMEPKHLMKAANLLQ